MHCSFCFDNNTPFAIVGWFKQRISESRKIFAYSLYLTEARQKKQPKSLNRIDHNKEKLFVISHCCIPTTSMLATPKNYSRCFGGCSWHLRAWYNMRIFMMVFEWTGWLLAFLNIGIAPWKSSDSHRRTHGMVSCGLEMMTKSDWLHCHVRHCYLRAVAMLLCMALYQHVKQYHSENVSCNTLYKLKFSPRGGCDGCLCLIYVLVYQLVLLSFMALGHRRENVSFAVTSLCEIHH